MRLFNEGSLGAAIILSRLSTAEGGPSPFVSLCARLPQSRKEALPLCVKRHVFGKESTSPLDCGTAVQMLMHADVAASAVHFWGGCHEGLNLNHPT